jgi:hypothetical protein
MLNRIRSDLIANYSEAFLRLKCTLIVITESPLSGEPAPAHLSLLEIER